jgi:hypothetical protein
LSNKNLTSFFRSNSEERENCFDVERTDDEDLEEKKSFSNSPTPPPLPQQQQQQHQQQQQQEQHKEPQDKEEVVVTLEDEVSAVFMFCLNERNRMRNAQTNLK